MLLLKHPTFITYHCISLKFSHFSDKADYPWRFPSCLFETLLKTLRARTAFPVSRRCSANPSLSSDRRHTRPSAMGGDGAAPGRRATPCRWVTPIQRRWFASGLMALGRSRTKSWVQRRSEVVVFLAHHAPSSETRTTGSDVTASFWVHSRWAHFFFTCDRSNE